MSAPIPFQKLSRSRRGFTLMELIMVIGTISVLSAIALPAARSVMGAGSVNRAINDISGRVELARAHAIVNNTYVRVAFAQIPVGQGRSTPATVVMSLAAVDGTLGADTDMSNSSKWALTGNVFILENFQVNDGLDTLSRSTTEDVTPSGKNTTGTISEVTRIIPGIAPQGLKFDSFIQFDPSGQARVGKDEPARHIKVAMESGTEKARNPFILRISGTNGTVTVLRKENGIGDGR